MVLLTCRWQLALPFSPASLRLRMLRGSVSSTFATCSLFHFVYGGVRLHAQLIKRYEGESWIQVCKTRSRALWVMSCQVVRLSSLNVMWILNVHGVDSDALPRRSAGGASLRRRTLLPLTISLHRDSDSLEFKDMLRQKKIRPDIQPQTHVVPLLLFLL